MMAAFTNQVSGEPGPTHPVAGWRLGLETGRVEAQRQEPFRGSDRAVRSIKRSLPRR